MARPFGSRMGSTGRIGGFSILGITEAEVAAITAEEEELPVVVDEEVVVVVVVDCADCCC